MTAVNEIMTKTVQTVKYDTAVGHVEDMFVDKGISGAPLVDENDNLVGFVTKSDISRFDSTGDDAFFVKVHSIASETVITVTPDTSIEEAAQQMLDEHVHHLVVIEDGSIVGILSAFDFVRLAISRAET